VLHRIYAVCSPAHTSQVASERACRLLLLLTHLLSCLPQTTAAATAMQFHAARYPTLPTASQQQLDALTLATLCVDDPAASGECIVCQEAYVAGERVLTLPCAHVFHAACITPWLSHFSAICPICR
jgi:hypothetical protein